MSIADTDRIKIKIRALLAKAQSTDSPGEAATFLAKASELMEKHQVELYELGVEDPIGRTEGVTAQAGPPSYKSDVQVSLARFYGAKPIINNIADGKWIVHIIGPESSRITTELMTDFVWKQVCAEGAKLSKDFPQYNRQAAIRHVAKALCLRIRQEIAVRKAAPAPAGSAFSLVVVDAVQCWVDAHYGRLISLKSKPKSISHAAVAAAKGISLHHQATDRNQLRLQ